MHFGRDTIGNDLKLYPKQGGRYQRRLMLLRPEHYRIGFKSLSNGPADSNILFFGRFVKKERIGQHSMLP